MTNSGNYPTIGGKSYHPDEGAAAIRIGGDLYRLATLRAIVGRRSWFEAVRDYRRLHPGVTASQAAVGLLAEHGVQA